jgi:Flp pilus assembly protein CpaB
MKRIVILVLLVVLAGIAGVVVRSSSGSETVAEIRGLVTQEAAGDVRDQIRQSFELTPGVLRLAELTVR